MTDDVLNDNAHRRLAEAEAALDAALDREASLRESEERYRSLFHRMGQGYCELELLRDATGRAVDQRYIRFNPAFERLFGIPVADAVGKTASEVFPGLEAWWTEQFDLIAKRGEPDRVEYEVASLGRWFEVFVYPNGRDRLTVLYEDITTRKQAEDTLRDSEEKHALLLRLTDALRPLTEDDAIIGQATRILGDYLRADRTFVAEMEPDEINLHVYDEHLLNGAPSVIGDHNFDLFGPFVGTILARGEILAVDDVDALTNLTPTERAHYAKIGIGAYLLVPLVRNGRFAACFAINHRTARPWSEADRNLARQTADRTWAAVVRARAEAALQASEARFQQFATSSSEILWIRDAKTLAVEFMSAAAHEIYGVEPETLLGDPRPGIAMIVPEDRQDFFANIARVQGGKPVVYDYRVQRADGAFRWMASTGFPLFNAAGAVEKIGGISADVTERRRLAEHQGVLLAELQHRVRNIMGIIRSTANRTAPGASNIEDYRSLLEGRLLALARVQALLTRHANAGGSLRDVIESEVAAQAHDGGQFTLTGPQITLSPKAVEVLTLAFHELAANALKYGALSTPTGRLNVTWKSFEKRGRPWLSLDWVEEGAPPRKPSTRRGFGSELIEARIPYELGGRGVIVIGEGGARCHLEFPLKDGESILETDAPQPAAVFGGSLDMSGAPDLSGRKILVVEDDYFLATDTAAALRGAGADVLGPCPTEEHVHDLLEDEAPTHAVLDLNLGGGGPRFELAQMLKARGIPFVFLTGYDPDVIPADMANVVRLQKPLPFRDIVEAVGQL